MRIEMDFDYRSFDPEIEASYGRFIQKSGAIVTNPKTIRLTTTGDSEVTVHEFWLLFNMWPLWDGNEKELVMGYHDTGFGIRLKDLP